MTSRSAAAKSPKAARTTRAYSSPRRARQAAQTRQDVVDAAIEVFREEGWVGATVAAIAERAGVSAETIYKGFGSKKRLLRDAMDAAIVGDAEPVVFAERPEFATIGQGELSDRIAAAARTTAEIHERSARVWLAVVEAAGSDPEVAHWRTELEQARRVDIGRGSELVLGERPEEELITLLWVVFGPETYLKLVDDVGYDRSAYEAFLVDAMERIALRSLD